MSRPLHIAQPIVGLLFLLVAASCQMTTKPPEKSEQLKQPEQRNQPVQLVPPEVVPKVVLRSIHDPHVIASWSNPRPGPRTFVAAVMDELQPVQGRAVRVFPRRMVLTNGTVLQADPKRLDESLVAMAPYLDSMDTFDERVTGATGRVQGHYIVDYSQVKSVELAVLDLASANSNQVLEAFEPSSYDQRILVALLTCVITHAQASREHLRRAGEFKTVTTRVRLPDGDFRLERRRVRVKEMRPMVPFPLQQHFEEAPRRMTSALAGITETWPFGVAQKAMATFRALRPGEWQHIRDLNAQTFDQVDPESGMTPRQQCVLEMERWVEEAVGPEGLSNGRSESFEMHRRGSMGSRGGFLGVPSSR